MADRAARVDVLLDKVPDMADCANPAALAARRRIQQSNQKRVERAERELDSPQQWGGGGEPLAVDDELSEDEDGNYKI